MPRASLTIAAGPSGSGIPQAERQREMALSYSATMKPLLTAFAILLLVLPALTGAQSADDRATDYGSVYVFRTPDDSGGAYSLTYQNQTLAKLKSGAYTVLRLPAGRQYLLADPKAEQLYGLDIQAGGSYYVRGVSGGNLLRTKPSLVTSNAREFESQRASLNEIPSVVPTP